MTNFIAFVIIAQCGFYFPERAYRKPQFAYPNFSSLKEKKAVEAGRGQTEAAQNGAVSSLTRLEPEKLPGDLERDVAVLDGSTSIIALLTEFQKGRAATFWERFNSCIVAKSGCGVVDSFV